MAVGSSWGPDNLSEAQLQHALEELTRRLADQEADATVLRTRLSLKPGTGERLRARGRRAPGSALQLTADRRPAGGASADVLVRRRATGGMPLELRVAVIGCAGRRARHACSSGACARAAALADAGLRPCQRLPCVTLLPVHWGGRARVRLQERGQREEHDGGRPHPQLLDDGRGLARSKARRACAGLRTPRVAPARRRLLMTCRPGMQVFKHHHEEETGRTSSIGQHNLCVRICPQLRQPCCPASHVLTSRGAAQLDSRGNILNDSLYRTHASDYIARSSKVITLVDLAGHERYFKTTAYGLTGHMPGAQ